MAISKDSDDMVDPGQADAPDLDAWRAEAGAALALTARAPSNIVEVIAEGGDPDVPISADEEAALPTAEQREAACGWVASARTGWPRDAARVAVLCARVAALEAHIATLEAVKAIGDRQEALADRFAARCDVLEAGLREALDGWDRSHFPAPVRRADAETIARLRAIAAGTAAATGEEPAR